LFRVNATHTELQNLTLKKRDEQGVYLDNSEWTSISDIGKIECNSPTYEEYEQIENAYVDAVKLIMEENGVTSLKVSSLEFRGAKEDFKRHKSEEYLQRLRIDFEEDIAVLRNQMSLSSSQVEKITRLILREIIWMILSNKKIEVEFGYDYYMYVKAEKLSFGVIRQIEKSGLFVEQLN
jgi:hypothetical protein